MNPLRLALGLIFALAALYFGLGVLTGGFLMMVRFFSQADLISLLASLGLCGLFSFAAAYTCRWVG